MFKTLPFLLFLSIFGVSGCREIEIPDYSGRYRGVLQRTEFVGSAPNSIHKLTDTIDVVVIKSAPEYTITGLDSNITPLTMTKSGSFIYTSNTNPNAINNGSGSFAQGAVEIRGGWIFTYSASENIDTLVTKCIYTFVGKRI